MSSLLFQYMACGLSRGPASSLGRKLPSHMLPQPDPAIGRFPQVGLRLDASLSHQLWKVSYSCRIGLAANRILHLASATLFNCASFRFLPRRRFFVHMWKWRATVGSTRMKYVCRRRCVTRQTSGITVPNRDNFKLSQVRKFHNLRHYSCVSNR